MHSTKLPYYYLDRDGPITAQEIQKLQAQADAVHTDPETGETVFDPGARPIWGSYQLTVTVNPSKNACRVNRRPHCQRQEHRHPSTASASPWTAPSASDGSPA